jgi:hypothetical protein
MNLGIEIPYDFHKSDTNVYAPRKYNHQFDWNSVFIGVDISLSLMVTIPIIDNKERKKCINAPRKHTNYFDWNIV